MPLIRNGNEIENRWTFVPDDAALPVRDRAITVSLKRYLLEQENGGLEGREVGIRLQPDDSPEQIETFLPDLNLIEISFPKYTDGRGYSQAQLLRRRYGYAKELRAVGHVLRDQILYMHRSGFDAFETERAALPSILDALTEFSAFYQKAADRIDPVFSARRASRG